MSICDSIKKKYIRLSKGQRKVAQYVLDNPSVVANHVAVEVGRLAGVSESTVIRFCYAMDLAGFSELQEKIKEHLLQSGVQEMPTKVKANDQQPISMLEDIEEISNMMASIGLEKLEQCASIIHKAKHVHIMGFTHSITAATWLYDNLHNVKENVYVHQYSNILTNEKIINVEPNSALILFIEKHQADEIKQVLHTLAKKDMEVIAFAYDKYEHNESIDLLVSLGTSKGHDEYCAVGVFSVLKAVVKKVQQNLEKQQVLLEV